MPFTFSHPALVLPITRFQKLSATALIIGSMVPDVEYFLRLKVASLHSHTFWGILYFDLPLVLLLSIVFHQFVRVPLLQNSPKSIYQLIPNEYLTTYFKPTNWWSLSFLFSALIGIFSHLVWDSFTHQHGFSVQYFGYEKSALTIAGQQFLLFKVLQHFSTLLGLFFIVQWIRKKPEVHRLRTNRISLFWGITGCCWLVFFAVFMYADPHQQIGGWIILGISSALCALMISAMFYSFLQRK